MSSICWSVRSFARWLAARLVTWLVKWVVVVVGGVRCCSLLFVVVRFCSFLLFVVVRCCCSCCSVLVRCCLLLLLFAVVSCCSRHCCCWWCHAFSSSHDVFLSIDLPPTACCWNGYRRRGGHGNGHVVCCLVL